MHTRLGGVAMRNLRTVWLPYCLQRREDGSYIPLNREGKPIGCLKRCDPDNYPFAFRIANMTPQLAARISHNKSPDMARIYLYAEAYAPETVKQMGKYLARLVLLAKQHVEYTEVAKVKANLRDASRAMTARILSAA